MEGGLYEEERQLWDHIVRSFPGTVEDASDKASAVIIKRRQFFKYALTEAPAPGDEARQ